jgi:V/A-type H+/Na+-transporting ATPase subunit I
MPAVMTKVQLIGRKPRLEELLGRLYELRLVQLSPAGEEPKLELMAPEAEPDRITRASDLRLLIGQIDGLLALAESPTENEPATQLTPADQLQTRLREELRQLTPQVDALNRRIETLRTEAAVLPRYLEPLRRLLPLIPELSELDENALAALQLDTIVLVLNTADDAVVETLRTGLRELLGDRFELVATRVDRDAIGCVIVLPHDSAESVRVLLGRERVRSLRLPETYERLSFRGAVAALERRLGGVPGELARARTELHDLLAPRAPDWRAARADLQAALEQIEAIDQVGETGRTFVVIGWTPRRALPRVRSELERSAGGELVLECLPDDDSEPPVLMTNVTLARPFEFLVRLFDLPRSGSFDPTLLMALFLPLMVGVMVGDIGYGLLLLGLSLAVRRRYGAGSPAVRDLSRVFLAGAVWAVVFGCLFGEAFGDVGRKLGLPALWFYRGGPHAVEPLLLFSLALGATHIVLGLLLGLWQSARTRRPAELLERSGSLVALSGVFALAGVAAGRLGGAAALPAAAAIIVGLGLLIAPRGVMGLIMGPLEFVGTIGNVLSYLRVGAVGLASTYLALVANQLGALGPLWLGLLIATFFHVLNLALASFSPMIQALRLHYVEFFSKFYEGGGKPFRPFGEQSAA